MPGSEMLVTLAGYFMPMHGPDVPVLAQIPGDEDLFVFVFSTGEKLVEAMKTFGIEYERVAIVEHGRDLLDSLEAMNARDGRPYQLRLAIDPHESSSGRVRFIEPLATLGKVP